MNTEVCKAHSGLVARIEHVEGENTGQWDKINLMDTRINTILTRINIILGGIAVSCILLAVNVLMKLIK